MTTITIKTGDQIQEIEARPITLIVPSADSALGPPIEYPGRFAIDAEIARHHAERVKLVHHAFKEVWAVFHRNVSKRTGDGAPGGYIPPWQPDDIRKMGAGAIHLLGLFDLSLKIGDMGVPIVWVHPETYLHPAWQCALGDTAIWFAERNRSGT